MCHDGPKCTCDIPLIKCFLPQRLNLITGIRRRKPFDHTLVFTFEEFMKDTATTLAVTGKINHVGMELI
jgi:hypothetical protein